MMAAYQPQAPAMHPGMAPHGHPAMTPGQPMNPAQLQQMGHPGVSGPGQPHVSQAGAMMAMQQGANGMVGPGGMGGQPPGAQMGGMPGQMGGQSMAGGMPGIHGVTHLNQQQMQQAMMQQHMAQNPQLLVRQQQLMQQRMMQAQMAQQGGVPAMQQGLPGMNPQQMLQMQQNPAGMHSGQVHLPPHLVQAQQNLMQQQRAATQQSAALQQHLAMQQANSQNGNQGGQPGQPNQQAAHGQHPGQMRPQSRMANPNEQNQAAAQPNAQQVQQGQPQGQPNQQTGQQPNPQQQGQQPLNAQQAQVMAQRRQVMQMQNQHLIRQQQQMAQNQQLNGQAILFFLRMCDHLCNFDEVSGKNIDLWRAFVDKHFSLDAELSHTFAYANEGGKTFTVIRASLARYFQKYFDSGAQSIRLHTEYVKEDRTQPHSIRVHSSSATIQVVYANGARLELKGTMQVDFTSSMVPEAIQSLSFYTSDSEETIGRGEIERLLSSWSPTMSGKASPKMTKKNLPKAQQKMQSHLEGLTIDHFPRTIKGSTGGPLELQQFLELGETFNVMNDLIGFAQERNLRPISAMAALVEQYQKDGPPGMDQQMQQGNPQLNLPPNGVPMTNRTPSMQSMGMPAQFNSPSLSHLALPNGMPGVMNGSPHLSNNPGLAPNMNMANSHTPSPHLTNMAAPQMIPQHSQQGTNSSAASANTSPNVNHKRRRSTVKMEGDDGGGEGGGAGRVKPSPRMGKKAKP